MGCSHSFSPRGTQKNGRPNVKEDLVWHFFLPLGLLVLAGRVRIGLHSRTSFLDELRREVVDIAMVSESNVLQKDVHKLPNNI